MEGVFTYLGGIFGEHNHSVVLITHLLLVSVIVLLIAKMATKSFRAVPNGTQNVMEAYLGGVVAMGKDVIGEELARKYLPLVAAVGMFIFVSIQMQHHRDRVVLL